MVLHSRANRFERVPQPVVAVGNAYPAGHHHPPHRHGRAQLLYAETGTMLVETEQGSWIVPPQEAVWIPAGIEHGIRMQSAVETRSVYFDAGTSRGFAPNCRVVGISPLLRHLLIEAAGLPVDYTPDSRTGRLMALIVEEVRLAPELPLSVPYPRHTALADACRRFAAAPTAAGRTEAWCAALAMSRRSFTRLFRRETGLSVAEWQRRVCLQAALPRLLAGERVTDVALDLGYAGPSAFTAMFARRFGCAPRDYVRTFGPAA